MPASLPALPMVEVISRKTSQERATSLEGLSALVTGATSGIGRAATHALGRHGAEVVAHGRDIGRGGAVVDAITAGGGKARFLAADLSEPARRLRPRQSFNALGPDGCFAATRGGSASRAGRAVPALRRPDPGCAAW